MPRNLFTFLKSTPFVATEASNGPLKKEEKQDEKHPL